MDMEVIYWKRNQYNDDSTKENHENDGKNV